MKSLKNHLSLILPLFSIFFAIEFYIVLDRVIKDYENGLREDYIVLISADREIDKEDLTPYIDVESLEEIDSKSLVSRLEREGISVDFESLKKFMPRFYRIKLEHFPTGDELKRIEDRLKRVEGVKRVETFENSHNKIYNMLIVLKQISKIFLAITAIISTLLIFKQMQVWYLEHRERMYIMELFGAPLWMRSGVLIRLAIVDTLLSLAALYGLFYYLLNAKIMQNLLGVVSLKISLSQIMVDMALLGVFGLAVTLFSVIVVSVRQVGQ